MTRLRPRSAIEGTVFWASVTPADTTGGEGDTGGGGTWTAAVACSMHQVGSSIFSIWILWL